MSNIKYNIKIISDYISIFNHTLLSTEYKNNKSPLKIICPQNHIFTSNFNNFKNNGNRCGYCFGNKNNTYEFVKNYIEKTGYNLLSTEYSHGKEMLVIMCEKGHKYNVCFNNFQQGKRCPICKPKYSKDEKELCNYIKTLYDGTIIENDRSIIKNPLTNKMLELDIYLPELNLAFEYNGDYWHSNKYAKFKDNQKIIQCKNNGIKLITISENEWINYKDICLKIINEYIVGRKEK